MSDSTNYDTKPYDWLKNTGEIPVQMVNDYLFKALVQESPETLKMLISAFMHVDPAEIQKLEIKNTIVPGETIEEKDYVLDANVLMNDNSLINLEMQVVNYGDWPERSLQYLCRNFDHLHKGEKYDSTKNAIHIGILNFNLSNGNGSLFSSYRMMDIATHRIYTEKFQLYTITLPEWKNPSKEDKQFHTDIWAAFFRAKTWEDLQMLVEKEPAVAEAAAVTNQLLANEKIMQRLEAREDYFRRQRTLLYNLDSANEELRKLTQMTEEEKKRTEEEKKKADEEKQRADEEKKRAEEEKKRADEEKKRADEEKKRADNAENEVKKYEELIKKLMGLNESEQIAQPASDFSYRRGLFDRFGKE